MLVRVNEVGTSFASLCVAILMACATVILGGCNRSADADKPSCIADSLGTLRLLPSVPDCAIGDWVCRAKCEFGDGASCLGLAYSAGRDSKTQDKARDLYRRACLLGEGNACTNYAASVWIRDTSDEQLACARRTFQRACSAKEPFACGMVGRVMLESMTPPLYSEGRHHLEQACDEVGGFSCRVLAMHLESGKLGEYQPELIHNLLSRACEGGDPDACGTHATASETFR
jgi:TPR repeat protein